MFNSEAFILIIIKLICGRDEEGKAGLLPSVL